MILKLKNDVLVKYKGIDSHVEIPKGVKVIGELAFKSCTFLKSLTICEGVTEIERGAFWDCAYLESVTLPKVLEYLETKYSRFAQTCNQ